MHAFVERGNEGVPLWDLREPEGGQGLNQLEPGIVSVVSEDVSVVDTVVALPGVSVHVVPATPGSTAYDAAKRADLKWRPVRRRLCGAHTPRGSVPTTR